MNIEPAITQGRWLLVRPDGTTPLKHVPTMPLTTLEKRWLKAICTDPRIRLFTNDVHILPDTEPLFTQEDISIFDRYADGDPYEDETYRRHFHMIREAIRDHVPLAINMTTGHKVGITCFVFLPERLEYSEKDDKFRIIGRGRRYGNTVNLARIVDCKPYLKPFEPAPERKKRDQTRTVTFDLFDHRNALERVLLHFAHFEKQAEKVDEKHYRISVTYDKDDETELVIRILSFGPMIRVTSPQSFVDLIKDRLINQKRCGL